MLKRLLGRLMAATFLAIAPLAFAGLSGSGGIELAPTVVTGNLTSATGGTAGMFRGFFNVTITGTFSGTVVIERSFDGGATFSAVPTDTIGTASAYTAPVSLALYEDEPGMFYRVRCSAYTSGTITYRLSGGPRPT